MRSLNLKSVLLLVTFCLGVTHSFECTSEHTYHANPSNCGQYVECLNGQKKILNCAPNFYWNDVEKYCDFASNVNCAATGQTSGTKSPASTAVTKSPGFTCPIVSDERKHYADPEDCSRYYECHQGQQVAYSCPPGFYFNPTESVCDFPDNVACASGTKSPTSPLPNPTSGPTKSPGFVCPVVSDEHKLYSDPQDCSRYYDCHQGQHTSYSCPSGFYFNAIDGVCDFPENVQCAVTPNTSGTKIPVSTTSQPATTKSPDFACPANSDEHKLFADPQDCSRYYECYKGQHTLYTCPSGFYFNSEDEVCDFPENVACGLTPKTSGTKSPTSPLPNPTSGTTRSPGFVCPVVSDEHKLYADPQDCSRYYDCHQGQHTSYSCPSGFYFNAVDEVCDFPDNVQCGATPNTSGTKTPVSTTSQPATTKAPGFTCPANSEEHKLFADPQDCSRYYECYKGQHTLYTCPSGFYFNSADGVCDFPENVACALTPKTSGTKSPTSPLPNPTSGTTKSPGFVCPVVSDEHKLYADPQDCSRYYDCHQGQHTSYSCPSGFYFNAVDEVCDFPDNVQCGATPNTSGTKTPVSTTSRPATTKAPDFTCPANSEEHKLFADPQDCARYYECYKGQHTLYTCPSGFYFNSVDGVCDFPENVACAVTPKTSGTKSPTSPLPNPTQGTTKSPGFVCPVVSDEHKLYADPQDCSRYYDCHQGQHTSYSCPSGFYFNAVEEVCDFPDNVQCDRDRTSVSTTARLPTTVSQETSSAAPATQTQPSPQASTTPKMPVCTGQEDGTYFPYSDCTKFIECSGGRDIVFTCPAGTTWVQAELTCDNKKSEC